MEWIERIFWLSLIAHLVEIYFIRKINSDNITNVGLSTQYFTQLFQRVKDIEEKLSVKDCVKTANPPPQPPPELEIK